MGSIERPRDADGERMADRESVRLVADLTPASPGRGNNANRWRSSWSGGIRLCEPGKPADMVAPVEGTPQGVNP